MLTENNVYNETLELLKNLSDSDFDVSERAYEQLLDEKFIDPLIQSFESKDQDIIQLATQQLLEIGVSSIPKLFSTYINTLTGDQYVNNYSYNTLLLFDDNELSQSFMSESMSQLLTNIDQKLTLINFMSLLSEDYQDKILDFYSEKFGTFENAFIYVVRIAGKLNEEFVLNQEQLSLLESSLKKIFSKNHQLVLQTVNERVGEKFVKNNKIFDILLKFLGDRSQLIQQNAKNMIITNISPEIIEKLIDLVSNGLDRNPIYAQNIGAILNEVKLQSIADNSKGLVDSIKNIFK